MPKPKVGERPNEFKYGMALYGAAWPEGPYYFVCGGGGHGLQNRIVWAKYENGRCSDQVGEFLLGADTPMKMVMCPFGTSLLVGMAKGGIRRLQIGRDHENNGLPKLVEISVAFQEHLVSLHNEPSTMKFNAKGNLLAVGLKDGGGVRVLSYPSMRNLLHWRLKDPEVKDLDFVHAPGQQQELLASVAGDGSCCIWQLQATSQGQLVEQQVAQLEPPKKLAKARYNRCRFARDGSMLLYVLMNLGRDSSHLLVYGPSTVGPGWQLLQEVKAMDQPASAFDISRQGNWLAAGDADGKVRVFDAQTLKVIAQDIVSIAFVSSVVFNDDNTAVMCVGGDANCHVLDLTPRPSGGGMTLFLLLLLVLLVFGGALLLHYWNHPEALPYQALLQLRQMSREGPLQEACSSGSTPLHDAVCGWVHRALRVLPDESYLAGMHDEL